VVLGKQAKSRNAIDSSRVKQGSPASGGPSAALRHRPEQAARAALAPIC
jgi:hypothetical protein